MNAARLPMSPLLFAATLLLPLLPASGQVHYHDNGLPWKNKANRGPDAAAGGWYYNLGITGIRVVLMPKQPTWLHVKYVFPGTPAHGRVRPGDVIVGVAGRAFATPHKNGYDVKVFGGDGPLKELALALEACQGARRGGKLNIHVRRQGRLLKVPLLVSRRWGRYAASFPFRCKKSDRIYAELCAYIATQQDKNGSWGPAHLNTFAPLALLASNDRRYLPLIEKNVRMHARTTAATDRKTGLVNWRYAAAAIVLSEYYLATQQRWVLAELEQIKAFLMNSQYTLADQVTESARKRNLPRSTRQGIGGWGHNPGYEGYGPICMVTAQGALALALMHRCGIKINRRRLQMAYEFLQRGTGRNGYVWYGDSPANHDKWADMGRTGASALANFLSPFKEPKYRRWALAHAAVIGKHPETLPDTHGSPMMGMGYTALGALIHPASFRKLLDDNRWWFTLAQCPDGTFYYQPNRDNNAQDFGDRSRLSASATVALIFAAGKKNLRITGAR